MNKSQMADLLVSARRDNEQAEADAQEPPFTRADAMDIQRLALERLGSPVIGWKIGATNEKAQKGFGIESPFYGQMAEIALVDDGGTIEKTPNVGAVEPEYAFRLARDYPADGEAVNAETAKDAIGAAHIAIEVIGRCLGGAAWANGVGVTMDFGGNAAFVVGPEIADWTSKDLVGSKVEAMVDGDVVETGDGTPVMGDPLASFCWLATTLAENDRRLKAGEWVSSGTCTPAVPAKKGSMISAKFGDFGTVSIAFS